MLIKSGADSMFYKIAADMTVFVHLLWILFLAFGALLGTRNKTARIIHVSGLAFAIIIQVFDWYCPFTDLEVWLRSKHDPALSYKGSFIVHYMEKIVYLEVSRELIFVVTILLCGFNLWLYCRKKRK